MDIYAKEGNKVIFLGKHGHDEELKYALRKLEVGKEYTINHIDVHSWCSYVFLKEIPEESFNTVMFTDISCENCEHSVFEYDVYEASSCNLKQNKKDCNKFELKK